MPTMTARRVPLDVAAAVLTLPKPRFTAPCPASGVASTPAISAADAIHDERMGQSSNYGFGALRMEIRWIDQLSGTGASGAREVLVALYSSFASGLPPAGARVRTPDHCSASMGTVSSDVSST